MKLQTNLVSAALALLLCTPVLVQTMKAADVHPAG